MAGAAAVLIALAGPGAAADRVLADPARMPELAERMDFAGHNVFSVEPSEYGDVLRSTPQRSASGLYLDVAVPGDRLSRVGWRWRVEPIQPHADIRKRETEDFGAVVFFIFGEPSLFNRDVPTLAYVWTATPVANGTVIQSVRFASLQFVQLHGRAEVGSWQQEWRNVADDFRRIFGHAPPELRKIAILNDNDQTGEPASALFGPIVCDGGCQ